MKENFTCPYCNKHVCNDTSKSSSDIQYVISKGKPQIKQYFHDECYNKYIRKETK